MNKSSAEIIRSGICDARRRHPNFIRVYPHSIVYLGGKLYQEAYKRTMAKMPPSRPAKGSAGGSRP